MFKNSSSVLLFRKESLNSDISFRREIRKKVNGGANRLTLGGYLCTKQNAKQERSGNKDQFRKTKKRKRKNDVSDGKG
jgi:hypothetical protein